MAFTKAVACNGFADGQQGHQQYRLVDGVRHHIRRQSTVHVDGCGDGFNPGGSGTFDDGAGAIAGCTSVVLTGGAANCVTSTLPVGLRNLTAAYGGDVNNLSSTSPSLFVSVLDPTDALMRNGFETVISGCPTK